MTEVVLTRHAEERLFERTDLLPSRARRIVRALLPDFAQPRGISNVCWVRRGGVLFVVARRSGEAVVMTVANDSVGPEHWKPLAGPESACRACGGGMEAGGRACARCAATGRKDAPGRVLADALG